MPLFQDSRGIAQVLRDFLNNRDFFKVSYRRNVQYLAELLGYNRWVAMSLEELVLREHYDFSGYKSASAKRSIDTFEIEKRFLQLGICRDRPEAARQVREVIQKLKDFGFLETGISGDTQASFVYSRVTDKRIPFDDAVRLLRQKLCAS